MAAARTQSNCDAPQPWDPILRETIKRTARRDRPPQTLCLRFTQPECDYFEDFGRLGIVASKCGIEPAI